MSGTIRRRARAREDIIEQAVYIAASDPDSATRFLDAIESTILLLSEAPEIGTGREFQNPALKKLRMHPVTGFPRHLIFYLPEPAGIDVVRVLHSSRDIPTIFSEAGG